MAFLPPNLNLLMKVWHGLCPLHVFPVAPPGIVADILAPCQLYMYSRMGTSTNFYSADGTEFSYTMSQMVRAAAGIDLRDVFNVEGNDIIEVPAGSGRYYYVTQVDDMHKGFTNEYRFATIQKCFVWPTPIP